MAGKKISSPCARALAPPLDPNWVPCHQPQENIPGKKNPKKTSMFFLLLRLKSPSGASKEGTSCCFYFVFQGEAKQAPFFIPTTWSCFRYVLVMRKRWCSSALSPVWILFGAAYNSQQLQLAPGAGNENICCSGRLSAERANQIREV